MLWILPGNVQAPDYFLIKSVCVLVIYKRLALIFSSSCALSDDILIFHKRRIKWGGCVYVFLILHCIPATLKLVFFPCTLHFSFFFFFHSSPHSLIVVQSVTLSPSITSNHNEHAPEHHLFIRLVRLLLAGWGNYLYKAAWCFFGYFGARKSTHNAYAQGCGRDSPGFVRFDLPK